MQRNQPETADCYRLFIVDTLVYQGKILVKSNTCVEGSNEKKSKF
jgi:hypothetical protein